MARSNTCKCGFVAESEDDCLDYCHECPYVHCDDPDCRALKVIPCSYPENDNNERLVKELRRALEPWERHNSYGGCSHAC